MPGKLLVRDPVGDTIRKGWPGGDPFAVQVTDGHAAGLLEVFGNHY